MPDRFIEFIFVIFSRSFRKIGYTKKMSFKIELMQPAVTKKDHSLKKKKKLIIFCLQKLVKKLFDRFSQKNSNRIFLWNLNLIFSLTHLKNFFFFFINLYFQKVKLKYIFCLPKQKKLKNLVFILSLDKSFKLKLTNACKNRLLHLNTHWIICFVLGFQYLLYPL